MDGVIHGLIDQYPQIRETPVVALMWLRIGRFEPAHAIVQDADRGIQAYIHGMLHRLEGDFWNANYWFRQTRDPELLASIQKHLTEHHAPPPWGESFHPSEFTQAVESLQRLSHPGKSQKTHDLPQVALLEWQAVWEKALKTVFFSGNDH